MSISQEELEDFQLYLKKKGASDHTILSYQTAVRQYYAFCPELSAQKLQEYKQYLVRHYRPSTVNAKIYGLNRYLRYLDSCTGHSDATAENYHLPAVRQQQKPFLDRVISRKDYEHLRDSLKADGNLFWYFLVHFLASTGARVSELVQIKAEHLRLGYMDLCSKGGKIRRIYFPDSLCSECSDWLASRGITSGFLFISRSGKPITPRGINYQLKQFAVRYGIDPNTVYAHSFRHLYAKTFLSKCSDISLLADLLGHESIETTKIYLTQTSAEQKALIDQIVVW